MFIPTGEFAIEHSEILRLMNFDNRAEASQLAMLNSEKYGGVEGLAHSLRTDLKVSLSINYYRWVCAKREPGINGNRKLV